MSPPDAEYEAGREAHNRTKEDRDVIDVEIFHSGGEDTVMAMRAYWKKFTLLSPFFVVDLPDGLPCLAAVC